MKNLCFLPYLEYDKDLKRFLQNSEIFNISFINQIQPKNSINPIKTLKCDAFSEIFAIALILGMLGVIDFDLGQCSGECNLGEEELEEICFDGDWQIILGEHLKHYDDFDFLLKLAFLLGEKLNADVFLGQKKLEKITQNNENHEQLILKLENLNSKNANGFFAFSCLDENKIIAKKDFLNTFKLQDKNIIKNCQIIEDNTLLGTCAIVSKNLFTPYEIKPFSEILK